LGYEEYLSAHQSVIDVFAHMNTVGTKSYEKAKKYLLDHPVILSSHAVGYMLLLCLDYQMDDQDEMAFRIATQYQLVQFCLDLASSSRQDPRSAVHPLFQRIDQNHDQYVKGFEDSVRDFVKKVKNRAEEKRAAGEESPLKAQREAVEQRAQLVAEAEAEAAAEGQEEDYTIDPEAPLGPGGLHPAEVFKTLPEELQQCFISQDVEMIKQVLMGMKKEDASYHFDRCIKSGLWNPVGGGGEEEEEGAE
jgi:cell division cycle protein 37